MDSFSVKKRRHQSEIMRQLRHSKTVKPETVIFKLNYAPAMPFKNPSATGSFWQPAAGCSIQYTGVSVYKVKKTP